ncbi:hypothetical protein BSM4216_0901 [Bacillus smithii]|nr:hypothetical protein BSM4216_0901 [Bacillus smithii]
MKTLFPKERQLFTPFIKKAGPSKSLKGPARSFILFQKILRLITNLTANV